MAAARAYARSGAAPHPVMALWRDLRRVGVLAASLGIDPALLATFDARTVAQLEVIDNALAALADTAAGGR